MYMCMHINYRCTLTINFTIEHRGDSLRRSAKSVIASVISQQLYSIPG